MQVPPSGCNRVVSKDTGGSTAVGAVTADSLLNFRGRNIAVKIDVERREISVFDGMARLFSENKIFLQVEIWSGGEAAIYYLMKRGFRLIYHVGDDFYFINDSSRT